MAAALTHPLQEGGFCQVGSQLYLIGGIGTPRTKYKAARKAGKDLDSKAAHCIDLDTLNVTHLPSFPIAGDHLACAEKKGVIHVTGNFRSSARQHWTLDTKNATASWVQRAPMPKPRGALDCAFLADGKMYCVGGGAKQWGPFLPDMFIYDPEYAP